MERASYIQQVESFVNSTCSATQQVESVEAIASLLKSDLLTVETLVKELGVYLTTTDHIIRGRGILLLAELLTCLASKSLDSTTIHSLIEFFSERLADWKALHGALVGCLALLRRKCDFGMVTSSDAKAVAQSCLQNLQVQSLGQHDRKLCFELLECLLDSYPVALASLGDVLIFGICEAIDTEQDPQCLMLTFRIVEVLTRLFPDPSGPLSSFAADLFEILGCYFPIHFTHPNSEDVPVKRDELSRALMRALSSTPLFEPFAIPLFLEKLSSSLPLAKIDSLKYLSCCTLKYGGDRMAKHNEAIWTSLKDIIHTSKQECVSSFNSESIDEITLEALVLLQNVISQNEDLFLGLIVNDGHINMIMNSATSYKSYNDVPMLEKQKLYAIGRILSVAAKVSTVSCNIVFESFFIRVMEALGISEQTSSRNGVTKGKCILNERICFGALYLCTELLEACRNLAMDSYKEPTYANEIWCSMLHRFSSSLTKALGSALMACNEDSHEKDIYLIVKALQIMATFPQGVLPISDQVFDTVLMTFMSTISRDFDKTFIWKSMLKALVQIGLFVDKSPDSKGASTYAALVIEKLIPLVSLDDHRMPFALKIEAISEISTTGHIFMLRIAQGLEEAIDAKLFEICGNGNLKSVDLLVQLLECYSKKVLPGLSQTGDSEEVALRFAFNIWNQLEKTSEFSSNFQQKELLDAAMMTMKLAVGICSDKSQTTIIQKAYTLLSASTFLSDSFSSRDEWLISLFASVIIALRPETHIPNLSVIIKLFLENVLKAHTPSAQALGSLVNKLPLKISPNKNVSNDFSQEEALDIILSMLNSGLLQTNGVVGLAWIGKGLLMRGHEKVNDIILNFLRLLMSSDGMTPLEDGSVMMSATDAFQILMSDPEDCLNKRFHAIIRPLYKQRLFSTVMPILLSSIVNSDLPITRLLLYRVCGNVISDTPVIAILNEANKLIPVLLDGLSLMIEDILDKDRIYSLMLVLSAILMDKSGEEAVIDNAHIIINCLCGLVSYPHMMLVRETAIQCLVAMSGLPHARIYPMRTQVLQAILRALDDPKRVVRQEAVRCRQAWGSIASRSLCF